MLHYKVDRSVGERELLVRVENHLFLHCSGGGHRTRQHVFVDLLKSEATWFPANRVHSALAGRQHCREYRIDSV